MAVTRDNIRGRISGIARFEWAREQKNLKAPRPSYKVPSFTVQINHFFYFLHLYSRYA